jgi:hypothetical protein
MPPACCCCRSRAEAARKFRRGAERAWSPVARARVLAKLMRKLKIRTLAPLENFDCCHLEIDRRHRSRER